MMKLSLQGLRGRGFIRAGTLTDWQMKSVHLAGVDVTDTPLDFRNGDIDGLEIELTQRLTTLSGTVSDDRGAMVLDGRARGLFNGRLVTAPRRRSLRPGLPA